jgi:cation transport ATPase
LQVPVDAKIVWGSASISTQHVTGESNPVWQQAGYEAPAGAVCHSSPIVLKAQRPASESTIARIAELTRKAQVSRSFWSVTKLLVCVAMYQVDKPSDASRRSSGRHR